MKLRHFPFNCLKNRPHIKGLSIFVDDKNVSTGTIGEVLRSIPHLADKDIKDVNEYFDLYVIRL